ncbi:hypothetical protein ABZM97_17230 [Bacillus vallismortis]|uniref:DUF3953 domain-containing protein n=1 Tax=Bacillus vallismortis TaxID=72361 RepID=A0ABY4XWM8_BACVA|nr:MULTISPECIES: hypothetical protein [Bacillus]MBL3648132.1 hypothetical protein [Bacillus sp. RHFS10]MDM5303235.1 hypothetical protein [Bacillus subtilis]MDM5325288.1 hypothetical protein [Bacillus subtilis]USP94774.1 hypothetical protein MKF32_16395 [Bacillus vallismortis]
MNHIGYFLAQFIFSCIIIAISFFNGLYIGKPFSSVLLVFILVLVLFGLLERLKKRFLHIRLSVKVFLSISAFLSAVLTIGLLTRQIVIL